MRPILWKPKLIFRFSVISILFVLSFASTKAAQYKELKFLDSSPIYVVEGKSVAVTAITFCTNSPLGTAMECGDTSSEFLRLFQHDSPSPYVNTTFGVFYDFSDDMTELVDVGPHGPFGTTGVFTITSNNRNGDQGNRIGIVRPGNYLWNADLVKTVYILENSKYRVGVAALNTSVLEGKSGTLRFYRDNYYTSGDLPVTLHYTVAGAANAGTDYSSLSGSVTIQAGTLYTDVTVSALNDSIIEGSESLIVTMSNDGFGIVSSNSWASLDIVDNYPVVSVEASDAFAWEPGLSPGIFTVTRAGNTNQSLTVHLGITGTATAGSDYTALPTNITFVAGQKTTNLVVYPIADGITEAAETVVLTLLPKTNYVLELYTNAVITFFNEGANPRDSNPRAERYLRGAGTNLNLYSEVIPIDGLRGTQRTNVEAGAYPDRYHYNGASAGDQTQIANRIQFNTPIVSFGAAWGAPLFVGQKYSVGLCYGAVTTSPVEVRVYRRSDNSHVTNLSLATPIVSDSTNWSMFATNAFARTVEGYGLRTVLRAAAWMDWGHDDGGFLLTHSASSEATNYYYLVCARGLMNGQPAVLNGSAVADHGYYYELTFDERPGWRSLFLDRPHFTGAPLPPHLLGKTPEELLNYGASVSNSVSLSPSVCTNIDHSPELRRHPILDQLVSDLNSDPIALANYVFNEIDLTDPIAYRDDGSVSTESIQPGGVNRGSLAVYQEGQGSPTEQCTLLVYLLRQAGYPAVYVFPPDGGLKMLDHRVSQLLRMRIEGGNDEYGRTYTTNQLLTVNYPWVAVHIDNQWMHLFPWLKQTEVIEGFNIADYLPAAYQDMQPWVRDYLLGKTNILRFARPDDDTPAAIFPRFLTNALQQTAPGLSVEDLGIYFRNRRMLYAQWSDFPRPTWVSNVSTAVESLASPGITNVSPRLTNIFDTVTVELISTLNPQKRITTAEMRMVDLHNRKFFLTHTNVSGTNVLSRLYLAPFRPDATNAIGSFAAADTNLLTAQLLTLTLGPSDDSLALRLRHRRQKALTWETAIDFSISFLDLIASREVLLERSLRKGDVAAICFNTGRVTPAMLRVHAEELWNMERVLNANTNLASTIPVEVYQGSLTYLCGMNYYERVARFDGLNRRLHKVQNLSTFAMGLAKLSPRRDLYGDLYNGAVDPIWPNVDMFFQEVVSVGNGTVRLDSGREQAEAIRNYANLATADGSAQEHAVLNQFFGQSNSVSTIKLLQLAQKKHLSNTNLYAPVQELNYHNYQTLGESTIHGKKLKEHDPSLWQVIVSYFERPTEGPFTVAWVPPGLFTNASGSFAGMGALILGVSGQAALIGNNQYGAYAESVAPGTISANKTVDWRTTLVAGESEYQVDFSRPSASNKEAAPATFNPWDLSQYLAELTGSAYHVNPFQSLQAQVTGQIHNNTPGNYVTAVTKSSDDGSYGPAAAYNMQMSLLGDPVSPLTGEFYVGEVDLTLPGPMPLVLRRNYGSQNLSANQLGYGWKLNFMPFLTLVTNNLIYASEADGSVIVFAPIATNLWAPSFSNNPTLHNQSENGIGSVANAFNARLGKLVFGTNVTWSLTNADGSVRVFEERSFPLTGSIDRLRPYLTRWYDCRSNYLSFEYGTNTVRTDYGQVRRVTSSGGNVLRLLYDAFGRVVEAYSLDGRRVRYDYDWHGDLLTVTRPDATELNFEYEIKTWVTNGTTNVYSTHLLTEESKPDGRLLRNEYDSQRRVTNQWATVGPDLRLVRNATFIYTNNFALTNLTNTITGSTTILDFTNRPTTLFYTNSLIRRIVDPLNREIVQTWYEANETNAPAFPRSLKSVVDRRGLVTSYQYDSRGNATNVTVRGDLRGDEDTNAVAVTSTAYNVNNLPELTIDPRGTTNLFFYTNTWLLARLEVWPSNGTANDAITHLYSYTSVTNTTNGTASFGLRQREIRAAGSVDAVTNDWDYDARGFVTRLTRHTGSVDPAVVITNRHNYRGELVESVDAAGRATRQTYDPNGRPQSREVFETGQAVPLAWEFSYYNGNGELTWSDGPRFDPEDYVWRDYDGAGRLTQEIRWRTQGRVDGVGIEAVPGDALWAQSFREYDPFDNLVKAVDPRGNYTLYNHDAAGQLLAETFYASNGMGLATNLYSYEPGGQVARATNALGGVVDTLYTSTGRPRYRRNADGSTGNWLYYADGRLWREFLRNGSYEETTYNDALRRVTKVLYAANGAPLATNVSSYDRRGNLVIQTDAEGYSFTNYFDGLDRLKYAYGPVIVPGAESASQINVQQATTNIYDASGRVFKRLNALGEAVVTTSDALGRTMKTEVWMPGGGQIVRVTTNTYAATHHGVTATEGTGGSAIARTTWTDTSGRPVLNVAYPAINVTEYSLTRYDAAGNVISGGRYAATNGNYAYFSGETSEYDGLNRLLRRLDRDSAETLYAYDPAGNVTNQTVPGGLNRHATFNLAGQVTKDWFAGGSLGSRTNAYAYYASNHFWAGLLQTKTDGRGVVSTLQYDQWLRPATNTYIGPKPEHYIVSVWGYDRRGNMLSVIEYMPQVGYDAAVTRTYNAYGSISNEVVNPICCTTTSTRQWWDSAGRRVSAAYTHAGSQFSYSYTWRPDGLLASVSSSSGSGVYTYSDSGLLTARAVGPLLATVSYRDGTGRVVGMNTTVNGATCLTELLIRTGDGLLKSHTLVRPDFTDTRTYSYADLSRRLIEERVTLDATKGWTNLFAYDGGAASGAGVLTRSGAPSAAQAIWTSGLDALLRPATATNSAILVPARGTVNGAATLTALLDGQRVPVRLTHTNGGGWQSTLEAGPGPHVLKVGATHPTGQFTAWATNTFTNASAGQVVTLERDVSGYVTNRVWRDGSNNVTRTQSLKWDGKGRLHYVSERDVFANGYDWSPVFDGLDRRLTVATIIYSNGVWMGTASKFLGSVYDPEVEFLEVAVGQLGQSPLLPSSTTWKLHGPDLNGVYGGLNGTGGFDAVTVGTGPLRPTISDARGNILGVYDLTLGTYSWNESRPTGYGAVPGQRPPPFGMGGDLVQSSAWRGRWADITGIVNLGARHYRPETGAFEGFDPFWNNLDPSGYSFAAGDPINYFDADGRWANWALNEVTGIDLQHQLPWREQLQAYREGGAEWVGPWVDTAVNLGLSALSPDPRLNQVVINELGSPMAKSAGTYDPNDPTVQAPADFGPAIQDVFFALGGAARTPSGQANVQARRPGQQGGQQPAPYEFQITHYSDKASGFQNHHGVLDRWAVEHVPGYASRAARSPTMRLSIPAHDATRRVFTEFTMELTGKPIAPIDWRSITPRQVQNLSERMFDAANVSPLARAEYYRAFHQYIYESK